MYSVGDAGSNVGNAFRLLLAGASVPVAAFGALWLILALFSKAGVASARHGVAARYSGADSPDSI